MPEDIADGFAGKSAVVTGAGSGIGRALALALAGRGVGLVLADIEPANAERVAGEARDLGGDAVACGVDVSDFASVEALARTADARFGGVDLLCNNAGVLRRAPADGYVAEDWAWMIGVNLMGTAHGVQAFLPGMLERGRGHIVNMASAAGLVPRLGSGLLAYTTSKYGVVGLSENLALELDGRIDVSVVCPAGVATGMVHGAEQHRPVRFGGDGPAGTPPSAIEPSPGMAPEQVAEIVIAGIVRKDLYILTHPEIAPLVRERFARLDAALSAAESNVEVPS